MNAKKNALGRGLSALIEESVVPEEIVEAIQATNEVELSLIEVNPFQPRLDFDAEALADLSLSIKQLGIIQPLTLRRLDNGRFQIIAGERRFRAAKMAGLTKAPAFIRSADDQAMLELALVENIQRSDLNAIEVAISYQRLIDECNLTQESLSDRIGKKRATVANYLRLLKLPAEIQNGIRNEQLSMGHARAILALSGVHEQVALFQRVVIENLSVREVEEIIRRTNEPQPVVQEKTSSPKAPVASNSQEYEDLRHHLSKHFSSSVDFKRTPNGNGKIIISFKNDEDLERILSVLDSKVNA